jgi:hypothetical protein
MESPAARPTTTAQESPKLPNDSAKTSIKRRDSFSLAQEPISTGFSRQRIGDPHPLVG